MELLLLNFEWLLIILSALPFFKNQHWIFRVPEFMKIQLLILQIIALMLSGIYIQKNILFWITDGIQLALVVYHFYILIRYTKFYKEKKVIKKSSASKSVKIISVNIFQFNKEFHRFHALIHKHKPDIFITMESNSDWELANRTLENEYPFTKKVTLENTYGMHLYSKIPFEKAQIHFFVAEDLPSIEAYFKTSDGHEFLVFAVHPPPPSPTEETTSKERDGDLLSVAKRIRGNNIPSLVIGDFNTVAWSTTSILFRKTSELIDARDGRGILATFHAKYWFFRFPLDLLFHSPEIFVEKLDILEYIGSDHFPILCDFHINLYDDKQVGEVQTLLPEEAIEVEKIIEEGIKEESENRGDVTEQPDLLQNFPSL